MHPLGRQVPAHLFGLGAHGVEMRVVELGRPVGQPLELPVFIRDLLCELLRRWNRPSDGDPPILDFSPLVVDTPPLRFRSLLFGVAMAEAPRPPQLPGHWLTGTSPELRRDILGFFTRCSREYGDLVALRIGGRLVHLAMHPAFVEQVLVTERHNYDKGYGFKLLSFVFGNGLVVSEGSLWRRQRRLMQPAFNRPSVATYSGSILECTLRQIHDWRQGETRDLHREMVQFALAVTGKTLMDIDLGKFLDEVATPTNALLSHFRYRHENLWNSPAWFPTPRNVRAGLNIQKLKAVINRIIQERRAAGGDRGDLLSKLIHARDENQSGMNDKQLRDEVMNLFFTGHETTANALSWTWYLLAQHPESDARLAAEVQAVVGDRLPHATDCLPYTEAVIKESLRLYPPIFRYSRRVLNDTMLGGFHIPAQSVVMVSQWITHRDPRWWDDADQFRPERWLSSTAPHRGPNFVYFPFGVGPRSCIGEQFALLEAKLAVATIAARFRFELVAPEKVRPWPSVTLRPDISGIPVIIHRRGRTAAPATPPLRVDHLPTA